jgi:hypothetical protein
MKIVLKVLGTAALLFPMLGYAAGPATYYVDSTAGNNRNSGNSPGAPWVDFTNINGKTLKAGERLLIKRGSVINQELRVQAQGSAKAWVEIGVYGKGARPAIRRNWDIADRCATIQNANYLRISGLAFSYAGKGLCVFSGKGQGNVTVEDCVVHHIEGIYREQYNMSGIPKWRNYSTKGNWPPLSGGIVMAGGHDMTLRNCDIFQTTWGFFVANGTRATIDGVNVHDNYVLNASPHPSVGGLRDSVIKNSIFDAAGYHAAYGTMGLMVGEPENFRILNCTFKNQPDSGSPDQGGIDFEANGDGIVVDRCTFENNAGPGIEVLGLSRPQPVNVTIRNSRFIQNSSEKHKFPGEIYIFGHPNPMKRDPKVECSTGVIHNNGYVLDPGVELFLNRSKFTDWKLRDNKAYQSAEELRKAMPWNEHPLVDAGEDLYTVESRVKLEGRVDDDGRPKKASLAVRWEVLEGPGSVRFSKSSAATTTVTLSKPGDYMLLLRGHDGELLSSDIVYVTRLAPGASLLKAWDFNGILDKEGWTEEAVGDSGWPDPTNDRFKAEPVKYVAGGFYSVVVKDTAEAKLVSPKELKLNAGRKTYLEVRMQNRTSAKRFRMSFTTPDKLNWDGSKSVTFDVVPQDRQIRTYRVDLSKLADWKGTIDQLRLEPGAGNKVSGTIRIDFVRLAISRTSDQ